MIDDETKYTVSQIIEFCHELEVVIIERKKTIDFLYHSGKMTDDLISEIRMLRPEHQLTGPELDYGVGRKGYVYQFRKLVFERYWCYIKIKIKIGENRVVVVLSFHEEDC